MASRRLWIGTFPVAGIGTPAGLGEGIWTTELDLSTGELAPARQVCETPAPSFLVRDPGRGVVHATSEVADGGVTTWREDGGTLSFVSAVSTGGAEPTHLTLVDGRLVACNYGDGTVAVLDASDGVPRAPRFLHHTGSGPVAERQQCSHAHSCLPLPGQEGVLVMDLGADEVRTVRFTGTDAREDPHVLHLAPGSGPRHGARRPTSHLCDVTCELSGDLATLAWDGHAPHLVGTVPVEGARLLSHIAVSGVASQVYVADRGTGLVHVFALPGDDDADPRPTPLGAADSGSTWPRHFAVVPDGRGGEFLVVAGQLAGRVGVLHRPDGLTLPRLLPYAVSIPSPAFVLPV